MADEEAFFEEEASEPEDGDEIDLSKPPTKSGRDGIPGGCAGQVERATDKTKVGKRCGVRTKSLFCAKHAHQWVLLDGDSQAKLAAEFLGDPSQPTIEEVYKTVHTALLAAKVQRHRGWRWPSWLRVMPAPLARLLMPTRGCVRRFKPPVRSFWAKSVLFFA